jgi:hypothetical protein
LFLLIIIIIKALLLKWPHMFQGGHHKITIISIFCFVLLLLPSLPLIGNNMAAAEVELLKSDGGGGGGGGERRKSKHGFNFTAV